MDLVNVFNETALRWTGSLYFLLLLLFHWLPLQILFFPSTSSGFGVFFVYHTVALYHYHLLVLFLIFWISDLELWIFLLWLLLMISTDFCCIVFSFNSENLRETLQLNGTIYQNSLTDIYRFAKMATAHGIFYKI